MPCAANMSSSKLISYSAGSNRSQRTTELALPLFQRPVPNIRPVPSPLEPHLRRGFVRLRQRLGSGGGAGADAGYASGDIYHHASAGNCSGVEDGHRGVINRIDDDLLTFREIVGVAVDGDDDAGSGFFEPAQFRVAEVVLGVFEADVG